MIEDFLHLPPVSLTPVANLELRISPRIFEKIRNDPNGILRGLGGGGGELIHEKTRSRKSHDTVPLIKEPSFKLIDQYRFSVIPRTNYFFSKNLILSRFPIPVKGVWHEIFDSRFFS